MLSMQAKYNQDIVIIIYKVKIHRDAHLARKVDLA